VIRACCPQCRLRFSPAATVYLDACPECGQPPQTLSSLEGVIGFRLVRLEVFPRDPESAAAAVAVQIQGRVSSQRDDDRVR
jgi:hypothetical protein